MARVKVVDRSRQFNAEFRSAVSDGAVKAAGKLRTFARRKVNRKFFNRIGRKAKATRAKKDNNTGASKPGEPPKRRSGKGFYSIEKSRNVGTRKAPEARTYTSKSKAPYMSQYEFGPLNQRRPWLRPAFKENTRELSKILTTPAKAVLRKTK